MNEGTPVTDDLVCFLPDKTVCPVIDSMETDPPIFALEHPRHGTILVRRHSILFPILGNVELSEAPTKVTCVNCRWFRQITHPAAVHTEIEDVPIVPSCWNPTFLVDQGRDYVTGDQLPIDPYTKNNEGTCLGFEPPPGDSS